MDVKELKLQTINYGHRKSSSFIKKVLFHAVTAFTCSLFCSYSHWFPTFCSRTDYFVYVRVPNALSVVLSPKCLFLVGNAIVLILVGESKLTSSSNKLPSSPDHQATEEEVHVEVSQTQTAPCRNDAGDHQMDQMLISEEDTAEELVTKEQFMVITEIEEEEEEEEEESGLLPAEELNKRVEEFIAKVNKERWLESRSLVCGRG